jgi:uncharacterized protein YbgA (DUF1722 family)
MEMKIRLGISACLLGEKVRYDGGHKLLILSHSPKHYQMMGRLVGQAKSRVNISAAGWGPPRTGAG